MMERYTISTPGVLVKRVEEHCKSCVPQQTVSEFTRKALLNQLEREGDFDVRDLVEVELNGEDA